MFRSKRNCDVILSSKLKNAKIRAYKNKNLRNENKEIRTGRQSRGSNSI